MSREFDSGRIEQVIMLSGLALFLVLATYPPDPKAWKRTWLGRAWRSI